MNRLQTKYVLASAATHALLFGVLVVGPAFLASRHPVEDSIPMEMVPINPDFLTDVMAAGGGGKPDVKQAPLAPAPLPTTPTPIKPEPAVAKPEPTPPPPEPIKAKPPPEPEPAKPEPAKPEPAKPEPVKPEPAKSAKDPDAIPVKVTDKPAKPEKSPSAKTTAPPKKPAPVKVNLEVAKRTSNKPSAAEQQAEQEAREQAAAAAAAAAERARVAGERRDLWRSTVRGLASNLASTGMAVEMPGPGGEAYANYRLFVKSVYHNAWVPPEDIPDDSATVSVKVIIARDGNVVRSEILTRSGIPALDKSVQATLNRVRSIGHPFPEGAKESEREFRINFNLKSKRSAG